MRRAILDHSIREASTMESLHFARGQHPTSRVHDAFHCYFQHAFIGLRFARMRCQAGWIAQHNVRRSKRAVSRGIGRPENRDDWNLLLLVESKNWAAFDGADQKFEAIAEKMVGPEKKQLEMMIKRSDVREIVGNKVLQEVMFK